MVWSLHIPDSGNIIFPNIICTFNNIENYSFTFFVFSLSMKLNIKLQYINIMKFIKLRPLNYI